MHRHMLRGLSIAAVLCGLTGSPLPAEDQPSKNADSKANEAAAEKPEKTRPEKIEDITLEVPESWERNPPSNKLRLAEFKIPPAEGDKSPLELTVFSFGGGGIQQNIDRWIAQFGAEDRKAKVTRGTSEQGEYVFVDISGTYKQPVGPPVLGKTETLPNARMLAVILAVEDKGVYYLKLAGPKKTVSANAKALRKAFGADAAKEKELGLTDEREQE
ncbi:MAG: hypothetical protein KY476_15530 [Planctomycetes bacterium]|nr:hypothetical protein [Planctomycetota bacterium]